MTRGFGGGRAVTVTEDERQMLLLALAVLSLQRPGWHWTLGELAAKYSTAPTIEDGRQMFEEFRRLNEVAPVDVTVALLAAAHTVAPRNSFTDAVDALDAAITQAEQ